MITSTDIFKANENGISMAALRYRLKYGGWDKDRALTEPMNARARELGGWRAIAIKNGIRKGTFNDRVYNKGWREERAATEPTSKYGEYLEMALSNGIKKHNFYQRVNKGWDKYKAATEPIKRRNVV